MFPEDPSGGFKLARELRRRHEGLPILLLTAVNQKFPLGFSSKDIDAAWLPVTGFVEKPVEFPVLLDKVHELLSQTSAKPSASESS
jgi:DNA-binding response OmpR family regulator